MMKILISLALLFFSSMLVYAGTAQNCSLIIVQKDLPQEKAWGEQTKYFIDAEVGSYGLAALCSQAAPHDPSYYSFCTAEQYAVQTAVMYDPMPKIPCKNLIGAPIHLRYTNKQGVAVRLYTHDITNSEINNNTIILSFPENFVPLK